MASLDELKKARLEKIKILKDAGMEAYTSSFSVDYPIKYIKDNFEKLSKEKKDELIKVSGRVIVTRGQGAILFIVLQDQSIRLQAVLKKDELSEEVFNLFVSTVDNGDFIGVKGSLFATTRGEQSILIKEWTMLTKALLPLPDKWHGLQDVEEKYRRRYLDMTMDNDVYDRFIIRAKIITFIRDFFNNKNFLEVETPILQNQAGGAMAKVFNTHLNDHDMPMVLRIALELDHKIIMAGGFNGVYEIGKCFRNEGSDPSHMQEFTMIEWYKAFETLETNMKWTEKLIKSITKNVIGKNIFDIEDKEGKIIKINFDTDWPRVSFVDLLKENAGIDITTISLDEIKEKALKWGMDKSEIEKTGKGNLLDFIYKKSSRNKIINPTFVTNFPSELKPLAEQNKDGTAEVAQLIIAGSEITNQYQELVDPLKQRELLITQSKAKENGDEEAMDIDERFLKAMEHGMPPMTGFGMGIDRLVAILTEQRNLRDTVFFPIMRPKE